MEPKRAAAYVRVSSFDQNTETQETALREYIQGRGWTLQKIYRDEGIFGTKASRPALGSY
jgi:DNA invertase Pin-like site-specific DNA recombinase